MAAAPLFLSALSREELHDLLGPLANITDQLREVVGLWADVKIIDFSSDALPHEKEKVFIKVDSVESKE